VLKGGRADGQIDATKPIIGFCSFANSPKNDYFSYRIHRKNNIFDRISGVWGVKRSEIAGGQHFSTVIGVNPPQSTQMYGNVLKILNQCLLHVFWTIIG